MTGNRMKFRLVDDGPLGGEAIGWLAEATPAEQRLVRCIRLWMTGPGHREAMWNVLAGASGAAEARRLLRAFEAFIASVAVSIERKINRHAIGCPCICRDEATLLEIIRRAGDGEGFRAAVHAACLVHDDRVAAVVDAAEALAREVVRGGGKLERARAWSRPSPAGRAPH